GRDAARRVDGVAEGRGAGRRTPPPVGAAPAAGSRGPSRLRLAPGDGGRVHAVAVPRVRRTPPDRPRPVRAPRASTAWTASQPDRCLAIPRRVTTAVRFPSVPFHPSDHAFSRTRPGKMFGAT